MMKDTRELILDAAIRVLSRNPGASLNEVAEQAGLGRATLYRYFPSREELIRELTLESYRQTDAALAPVMSKQLPGEDLLLEILEAIIPLGDRFYFLLLERTFEEDPEIQARQEKDAADWQELFDLLKVEGRIAPDVPTAWAVAALEALIYAAWSSAHDGYIASRDAAKLVQRTLLSGLGS